MRLLALLVLLPALLVGCGGQGDEQAGTSGTVSELTTDQQQTMEGFDVAAASWCQDSTSDPAPLLPGVLATLAAAPTAPLDDGTGRTVSEAVAEDAQAIRPCEAVMARQLETALAEASTE